MKKRYIALALALLALCLLLVQIFRGERSVGASPGLVTTEGFQATAPAQAPSEMKTDVASDLRPDAAALAPEEQDLEGLPACPSTAPRNRAPCDAVEYAVRTCAYTRGTDELVCECTTNGGREAAWQCRSTADDPPEVLCPESTPTAGDACPVAEQSCMYGEGPTASFCNCQGGPAPRWKCRPYGEVYPMPK